MNWIEREYKWRFLWFGVGREFLDGMRSSVYKI